MTEDQKELILYKVKEMLKDEDIEAIFEELPKNDSTNVENQPILTKKNVKILIINNNNNTIEYDEETIAKILAK
jgi:hypothetical protein